MRIAPPSLAARLILPRCHRLVAAACMLALVFLGLTVPDHVHASEPNCLQAVAAPDLGDDHCPGPLNAPSLGHCGSIHADACCVPPPATSAETAVRVVARAEVPPSRWTAPLPGPPLRPPTVLVA